MITYPMALIYLGFFGLIGFTFWITSNPWVLAALIFAPRIEVRD
jgi:hypothetical protein